MYAAKTLHWPYSSYIFVLFLFPPYRPKAQQNTEQHAASENCKIHVVNNTIYYCIGPITRRKKTQLYIRLGLKKERFDLIL